jgi:hypothetical protein
MRRNLLNSEGAREDISFTVNSRCKIENAQIA